MMRLKSCLHQIGLWGICLFAPCCRRASSLWVVLLLGWWTWDIQKRRERESPPTTLLRGFCFSSCLSSFPDFSNDGFLNCKCKSSKSFLLQAVMVMFIPATVNKLVQVSSFHELSLVEVNILFHIPMARLSSLIYSTPEKYGEAVCLKVSLINSHQSLLWET